MFFLKWPGSVCVYKIKINNIPFHGFTYLLKVTFTEFRTENKTEIFRLQLLDSALSDPCTVPNLFCPLVAHSFLLASLVFISKEKSFSQVSLGLGEKAFG